MSVIEMNPRVSRPGAGVKAPGFRIANFASRRRSATRSTRSPTTSRRCDPASFEPTIDMSSQDPSLRVREFKDRPIPCRRDESVGEGWPRRNFAESLQKACAGGSALCGLTGALAEGAAPQDIENALALSSRPSLSRPRRCAMAFR